MLVLRRFYTVYSLDHCKQTSLLRPYNEIYKITDLNKKKRSRHSINISTHLQQLLGHHQLQSHMEWNRLKLEIQFIQLIHTNQRSNWPSLTCSNQDQHISGWGYRTQAVGWVSVKLRTVWNRAQVVESGSPQLRVRDTGLMLLDEDQHRSRWGGRTGFKLLDQDQYSSGWGHRTQASLVVWNGSGCRIKVTTT